MDVQKSKGGPERILSALAAAFSLVVTARIWGLIAPHQEMWPLPALYLAEGVLLPAACAASLFWSTPYRARLTAMAAGALLAFSILGALSIGLFYVPLVALLVATVLAARVRTADRLTVLLAYLVGGALVQGSVMLLVVRWM